MYFAVTVASVLAVVVSAAVLEDPACLPVPAEKKHVHAVECCKMHIEYPESMMGAVKNCMKTHPLPPPHKDSPPLPDMPAKFACMGECVFQNLSLLTEDKQLDTEAVEKYFSGMGMDSVVNKCLETYVDDINTSLECKSGAEEFHRCLNRQTFLSCPEDKFSASEECDAYKAKVVKCPKMPVHMGPPPPHHHHESS